MAQESIYDEILKKCQGLKYGQLPPESDQVVLVQKALEKINSYSFYLKREFDNNNIPQALKHATSILEEMKTDYLSPQRYNEIYQPVLSELSNLAMLFQDPQLFDNNAISELYETLQYTESIVPRLYFMFTISPAFSKVVPPRDILRDLIEMCRGVQHPTRALFLRHFLLHITKELVGKAEIEDSLNFILENFRQMNVLWVRLEFSLNTKTTEERKIQRKQLCELVGSNIQRIGGLRNLDITHYTEIVLKFLLNEVISCKESMAQNYIIESLIQVFPIEYHVETLDSLFDYFTKLEDDVNTLDLVNGIIKRLETYTENPEMSVQIVRKVARQIDLLLKNGQEFPIGATLGMLGNLLNLSLSADSSNFANVNSILQFVENYLANVQQGFQDDPADMSRNLRFFLLKPLREMKDASMYFELEDFPQLIKRMRYIDRKAIAIEVSKSFIRTETFIDTPEKLRAFFSTQQVLLKKPADFEPDDEDGLVFLGAVFHLIRKRNSIDDTFSLISTISESVQVFDALVKESLYLPLGQAILRLTVEIDQYKPSTDVSVRSLFQKIYQLLVDESDPPTVPTFWLFVDTATISDRCGTDAITYEFLVLGLKNWKNGLIESNLKFRMLISMIKKVSQLKNLNSKNYHAVANELCNCSASLLTIHEQAEAHLLCSHLYCLDREAEPEEEDDDEGFKSPDKIKNCLVRALKATSQMIDPFEQLPWYYRVLAHAIYFIEKGIELPMGWFNALLAKIDNEHNENQAQLQTRLSQANRIFYKNLIKHKDDVIHVE